MAVRESQRRAADKWDSGNMGFFTCKIKREYAERFKAYCATRGITPNTAIREFILSCIEETPTDGS